MGIIQKNWRSPSLLLHHHDLCLSKSSDSSCTTTSITKKPKSRSHALLRPDKTEMPRTCRRIFSVGIDDDFIITFNINTTSFYNDVIPAFSIERKKNKYGSTYCNGDKISGSRATVSTEDLMALVLYYLHAKGPVTKLCQFFGLVKSSLSFWLDYAL